MSRIRLRDYNNGAFQKPSMKSERSRIMPSPEAWNEELRALRAELSRLDTECKELRAAAAHNAPTEAQSQHELQNMFSYAVHISLTGSPVEVILATLQLLVVTGVTVLYAFAFFDASWLNRSKGEEFEAFAEFDLGNFYSSTARYSSGMPRILHYTQIIGCILLGTMVRSEDAETLHTPFPAAILLYHVDLYRKRRWWRVLAIGIMQLCWTARTMTPVFMLLGVGHALAAADDAQAIIYDALAAAFLIDMDSLAYTLMSKLTRERYEAMPPLSTMGTPATATTTVTTGLVEVYVTLQWVLVVVISLSTLFSDINNHGPFSHQTYIGNLISVFLVRAGLFGVAHAHLTYVHLTSIDARPGSMAPSRRELATKLVCIYAVASMSGGLALFCWQQLTAHFGHLHGRWWEFYPCLSECLRSYPSEINGTTCFDGLLLMGTTCDGNAPWSIPTVLNVSISTSRA